MENPAEQFFYALSRPVARINLFMDKIRPYTRERFPDHWMQNDILATVDHIGYKCGSTEEFERLRAGLERREWSKWTHLSTISDRRIAIFRFERPALTCGGYINYLELSDQKPDGSQVSGFDHFEIFPNRGSAEDLAKLLNSHGMTFTPSGRSHHPTWDMTLDELVFDGLKVRIEAEPLVEKIKRDEMR